MTSENISPNHPEPSNSSIDPKDLEDWQKYQSSMSLREHSMRNEALLNLRLTKNFIREHASKYDKAALTDEEISHHLKIITEMVSQIEHFSFESWRDARKARNISYATLIVVLAISAFSIMKFFLITSQ